MKQLVCEMCGSNDLIKQDGVFVCQSCGCKYTVEEARKLMVEGTVEVKGTVKVDNSEELSNNLINAKRAFEDKRYRDAERLYSEILRVEPDNAEAVLCQGLAKSWQGTIANNELDVAERAYRRAVEIVVNKNPDTQESAAFINYGFSQFAILAMEWSNTYTRKVSEVFNRATERNNRLGADFKRQASYLHDRDVFKHAQELALQQMENLQNETKKETDTYYDRGNQCLSRILLEVYFVQVKCNEFIETKESIYRFLKTALDMINKNVLSKKPVNGEALQKDFDVIYASINKECRKYDEKKAAKYWEEHIEDKQRIDQEINSIEPHINKLTEEMEKLSMNPQIKEYDENSTSLMATINEKKVQLKNLGFFKLKEKKQLESEIYELSQKYESLNSLKLEAQNKIESAKNEYLSQIESLKNRKKQLENDLLYPKM